MKFFEKLELGSGENSGNSAIKVHGAGLVVFFPLNLEASWVH